MSNTKINIKSLGLKAGLLGVALSTVAPVMAAPRNRADREDVRRERRDVKEARREVKRERRDVSQADTPAERRREQRDVQDARRDLNRERQELRRERREDGVRTNRPGYGYGSGNRNGLGYGNGYAGQRYTGVVTSVRSSQSFDVRIGGSTYNVYALSRVPRALSVGDSVRVSGVRVGGNDIREASVSIILNR